MKAGSKSLRLLCVSHYFESHRGGIEMVAGSLARSLAKLGADVIWAASDASPAPCDVPALALRASNLIEKRSGLPFPLPTVTAFAKLRREIRQADAVLVHDGMYLTSIVAIVLSLWHRRPVVLVQHIGRVPGSSIVQKILFSVADHVLTRSMLRAASQVVFISSTCQRHFSDVHLTREPIVIFNGVDGSVFNTNESPHSAIGSRDQIGWPSERPVILFVGRFLEKKGLLRLREMAKMRPDYHWAFVGWGQCDPEAWALPNVSIHRNCSPAKIANFYRAADVLALPSKSEGFPLVVQEALACGLRPVCCDDAAEADPDARWFIASVSNNGSETEIVMRYLAAIDALAKTGDTRAKRASRGEFALKRYAWEVAADRYLNIFHGLMSESSRLHVKQTTA